MANFVGTVGTENGEKLTEAEKYKNIARWAAKARGQNPDAFDTLIDWVLNDSEWSKEMLAENEQILIHGVLEWFKKQNKPLRTYLSELEPSGVVNSVVFKQLDRFDSKFSEIRAFTRTLMITTH